MNPGHSVAIVVSNGDLLAPIAIQRHVWALRTPETEAVAQWFWDERLTGDTDPLESGVTLFSGDGAAESDLLSILDEVVLHHQSHVPPVDEIAVYGAHLTESVRDAFASLGFARFNEHTGMFVAYR